MNKIESELLSKEVIKLYGVDMVRAALTVLIRLSNEESNPIEIIFNALLAATCAGIESERCKSSLDIIINN